MSNRHKTVSDTRNYVLSVCALVGVGGIISLVNAEEYPLLKISAVAFGLAILIAVVHIGFLYWEDLYKPTASDEDVKFLSCRVRGKFSLLLFIVLIAVGLILAIFQVATV